jgi:hypothetical protein
LAGDSTITRALLSRAPAALGFDMKTAINSLSQTHLALQVDRGRPYIIGRRFRKLHPS